MKGSEAFEQLKRSALQKLGIIDQIVLAIGKSEDRSDANLYTWQSNNSRGTVYVDPFRRMQERWQE